MVQPIRKIDLSIVTCWNCILLVMIAHFGGYKAANAQENWSRFRGDRADGVAADDARLPEVWDKTKNVVWSADVPGLGWSCPIVWGNRVFLTSVSSDEENTKPSKGLYLGEGTREPGKGVHHWWTMCFDLDTGKELWRRETHAGHPTVPRHPKSSYAAETAATDGERVYVLFGDVGLYCYDFEGELLWSHPIEPKKTFYSYGAASSPVVHDGQVFIVYDNLEASWVAAFDAKSGELRWKQDRKETKSWATPFVWQNEQRTEVVVPGQGRNRSYSLTGELLWESHLPLQRMACVTFRVATSVMVIDLRLRFDQEPKGTSHRAKTTSTPTISILLGIRTRDRHTTRLSWFMGTTCTPSTISVLSHAIMPEPGKRYMASNGFRPKGRSQRRRGATTGMFFV